MNSHTKFHFNFYNSKSCMDIFQWRMQLKNLFGPEANK